MHRHRAASSRSRRAGQAKEPATDAVFGSPESSSSSSSSADSKEQAARSEPTSQPKRPGATRRIFRPSASSVAAARRGAARDAAGVDSTPKREIDEFLEELKTERPRSSAERHGLEAPYSASAKRASGSHDRGDPTTTNLFVGNLVREHCRLAICASAHCVSSSRAMRYFPFTFRAARHSSCNAVRELTRAIEG